jgi:hypothetical protein
MLLILLFNFLLRIKKSNDKLARTSFQGQDLLKQE